MLPEGPGFAKDGLTGCFERNSLVPLLDGLQAAYSSTNQPFSVLVVDVDKFKSFNDIHGHLAGDEVLKYFASSLRLDLEDFQNYIFRFGGDEFVVVFPNKSSKEVYSLTNRLKRNIKARSFIFKGKRLKVTFSGGIASFPHDAKSTQDLLEKADKALYFSKKQGRKRATQFNSISHIVFTQTILILVWLAMFISLATNPLITQFFSYGLNAKYEQIRKDLLRSVLESLGGQLPQELPGGVSMPAQKTPDFPSPVLLVPPIAEPSAPSTQPEALPLVNSEPAPAKKEVKVYLKTGSVITGAILKEDEEELVLKLLLSAGEGVISIKKANITKISSD